MNHFNISGMSQTTADALRAGGPDAHGNKAERTTAGAGSNPCRCCLGNITEGEPMLLLSYRPFKTAQAFAEQGPVFLHANHCSPPDPKAGLPAWYVNRPNMLVRAYDDEERIVYGTGSIIAREDFEDHTHALLSREDVATVHVRSSGYNCFLFKVTA